ncbi:MAG: glycosyltransferase [Chloroflexota bacterium]
MNSCRLRPDIAPGCRPPEAFPGRYRSAFPARQASITSRASGVPICSSACRARSLVDRSSEFNAFVSVGTASGPMACGTPVACSATSSLGEIAGDAALTFDPEAVDEIVGALGRLTADQGLRDSLCESGLDRAARFSWARAAAETWAVYQGVLGS